MTLDREIRNAGKAQKNFAYGVTCFIISPPSNLADAYEKGIIANGNLD